MYLNTEYDQLSNKILQAFLLVTQDALLILTGNRIVGFNQGANQLFGNISGSMMNNGLEILFPEDLTKSHNFILDICRTNCLSVQNKPYQTELLLKNSDKSVFWAGISINEVAIENLIFLILNIHDISKQKLAEESSKVFKKTFDLSNEAMIIHDDKGQILLANGKSCELLEYSEDEILRKNISDIDSMSTSMHWFEEDIDMDDIEGDICEVFFLKKDQSLVPAESTIQLIDYGGLPSALLIFRDITQRKQIEKALYESMIKYQSYLNNAPDSVIVTDGSGRIKEVNTAFSRITQFSQGELMEMSFSDLVAPEHRKLAENFFRNIGEQKKYRNEFIVYNKTGYEFLMLVEGAKLSRDRFIWFGKDLTEINGMKTH